MSEAATKTTLEIVSVCRTYSGSYEICVEEGEKRRIVVIPPDVNQVQRVVDAARVINEFPAFDPAGSVPRGFWTAVNNIRDAVGALGALDAPRDRERPRYFILEYSQGVWINDATLAGAKDIRIGSAQTRELGEMMCAALNAQERKP